MKGDAVIHNMDGTPNRSVQGVDGIINWFGRGPGPIGLMVGGRIAMYTSMPFMMLETDYEEPYSMCVGPEPAQESRPWHVVLMAPMGERRIAELECKKWEPVVNMCRFVTTKGDSFLTTFPYVMWPMGSEEGKPEVRDVYLGTSVMM